MPSSFVARRFAFLATAWTLALPAIASAQPAALSPAARPVQPSAGALVIIGGNGSTPAIWDRFMELAGGDSAVIVYFPTASAGDIDTTDNSSLRVWRERHPKSAVIMHTRSRDVANSDAFVAPLRKATGVWFGGGVQSRITDAYKGTKTEEALHDVLRRGGVIGGTSAGAAIMTEVMITGGNPEATLGTGFGFLPAAVADQHFTQRKRQPRLVGVLARHPGLIGFGIDEATALIVHGSRGLEVLGKGRVNVITALPGAPVDSTLWREAPAVGAAAAKDSATRAAGKRASPPRVMQGDLIDLTRGAQARTRAGIPATVPPVREPARSMTPVPAATIPW
jgi:cyanophycinase